MAYLLNATKTPTACLAPIYGQNTPHFSHTVIIIIFFCLATSTRIDVDHAIIILGVMIFQLVKLHEHF